MARYAPLSGRSAGDITFENAVRNRERRLSEWIPGSDSGGVLPDESWDSFYGGLDRARETANEQGRHFRMDTDGLGGGSVGQRPSLARMGRPGDEDTARNWALNSALSELAQQGRVDTQALRGLTADADMREAAARQAQVPMQDQAAIDHAAAVARTGQGVLPAAIQQTGDGSYQSRGTGPTADPRQVMLQNLPGHLQPVAAPVTFGAPQAAMVGGKRQFVRAGSDGQMYDMSRQPVPADALAPDADNEPLVAVMGAKGPVLVPRSQAVGKTPASTREQGRPVTSGDAGDLADFDTSKDELAAVRAAIAPSDSTGIVARVGSHIPYVTQITGWGSDAKKRQAVIDRVKQVIGKTLEGGVLRKEDEAKYEKILPNIGDAPDVATAKLNGLDAAIDKRKQRRMDALKDAGYETTQFEKRGASAGGGGTVKLKAPDGSVTDVPADQVDHYLKLGAKRVGG